MIVQSYSSEEPQRNQPTSLLAPVERGNVMKAFLKGMAAIAVLAMAVNTANAGFISGFVGNTQMDDSVGSTEHVTAVVSFAVYDNSGDDFDTGVLGSPTGLYERGDLLTPEVDLSAPFIYLYQITNFNVAADNLHIRVFYLTDTHDLIDAIGFFSGRVFTDTDGNVGPSGNEALGDDSGTDPVDPLVDDVVTLYGSDPGFASLTAAGDPDDAGDAGGGIKFIQYTSSTVLSDGAFSSVIIATSNFGPSFRTGILEDGGDDLTSDGNVPVPTPEPATLALLLGGAPVGLVALRRRRKTA
ncbi:MAG: PEP-CTERM sorting domain-containing protein [Pirellulales bacterium]